MRWSHAIGIVAMLASASAFEAAAAQPADIAVQAEVEQVTVEVPTGDLDLASDAGRKELDARLMEAARRVCGKAADIKERAEAAECRAQALSSVADDRDTAIARASLRPREQIASAR